MSKDAINQYDKTAANNLDVGGISTAENSMKASDVNNAFREIMSHLADVNDGTSTLTSPAVSGDFTVDTNTLFVDATNNVVGIGTTTSKNDALLTIKDNATNPVARVCFDRTNFGDPVATTAGVNVGYTFGGESYDFEIANKDAGLVRISTSNTERLRVESDGDVLVGGTANVWPEKLLVQQASSDNKVGLGVYAPNTSYTETLVRAQSETAGASDEYKFFEGRASGGATRFWITSTGGGYFAGKVSIGAATGAARLSLGTLVDNKVFGLYDDGTNFYGQGIGSANYKFNKPSSAHFTFNDLDRAADTTTELARIDNSGALNIGANSSTSVGGYNLKVESTGNVQQLLKAGANSNSTITFADATVDPVPGQILYAHNGNYMRFWVNGAEAARFNSSGDLAMAAGNGIDFSANANASGMTSEILDRYEEGSWTATLAGTTTAPSSAVTVTGTYTRIGRFVFARALFGNVNTTGASGMVQITGFPYNTVSTIPAGNVMGHQIFSVDSDAANITPFFASGTQLQFYQTLTGTRNWLGVNIVAGSGKYLYLSVYYETS